MVAAVSVLHPVLLELNSSGCCSGEEATDHSLLLLLTVVVMRRIVVGKDGRVHVRPDIVRLWLGLGPVHMSSSVIAHLRAVRFGLVRVPGHVMAAKGWRRRRWLVGRESEGIVSRTKNIEDTLRISCPPREEVG